MLREQGTDASETGASENEENPVILLSVTPAKTEPVKNKVNLIGVRLSEIHTLKIRLLTVSVKQTPYTNPFKSVFTDQDYHRLGFPRLVPTEFETSCY